eukprot:5147380-Amphidinium_carterae.1
MPGGAIEALQKSVVWYPKNAIRPDWLSSLGNAYGSLGDATRKRDFLERALRIYESHFGPEHPHVARTLTNLGNAYESLGDATK